MRTRPLGTLGPVSELALGGGGIGMLWGETTRSECVATVVEAIEAGITLLDMAPRYGDGLAETIVGEALGGRPPAGVRISTKCLHRDVAHDDVGGQIRRSLDESLARMRIDRADLLILHAYVCADDDPVLRNSAFGWRFVPHSLIADHIRPTFEQLRSEGRIGHWGLTGTGDPDTMIKLVAEGPKPGVIQCIANVLDSPGSLKYFHGPAKPREIIAAAVAERVGVMGIRVVQGGALADEIDRPLPADHPEVLDFERAVRYRAICRELGMSAAAIAHRYALSLPGIDTVVLGVKNRRELRDCIDAASAGPLSLDVMARLEASVA